MNLEEIEEKYVNTPVSMEQAEKLLTDYLPILIAEVKRLRAELEESKGRSKFYDKLAGIRGGDREILEGQIKCAFEVIKQLQKRCCQLREDQKRLQKLAGDFLGTDPEMQNTACIEVAITHAKWLRKENYRLREQLELERDQGERFLVQIKDVRAEIEIERLKADLDGFIHGGL